MSDEYIKRIEGATPLQLTVINYELLLANMEKARKGSARSAESAVALDKAKECLAQLYVTLDMDIEFSKDLSDLYLYVNRALIHAGMKRTDQEKNELLEDAISIVTKLLEAWQTLAADDGLLERLVGSESQQIFAGLTYGKDGKLEEYQDFDPNRGYKA